MRKQVENGIDIVTDGEMSKVSFLGYVKDRLGGFEVEEGGGGPAPSWQVEIDMFPEYYADYMSKYSAAVAPLRRIIARGPISYVGHDLLQIDIDNLKAAVAAVREDGFEVADVFMPSSGPSGFGSNEYYASNVEYLEAVGEAMREEYLGDRRRRLHPADRRPVADRVAHRIRPGRGTSASSWRTSTSTPSTTPCVTSRPTRSGTTRATASTTGRASPTCRSPRSCRSC